VIRQAITCDICGTEKKQTNHWFVAYDQAGELRVSGWSSRNKLRPGSKHLCGQTCLHKLVDEFMARAISKRVQPAADESQPEVLVAATDTSLTSSSAHAEFESSARLLTPPVSINPQRPAIRALAELVAVSTRPQAEAPAPVMDEPPAYASHNWRAEAWNREREREMHSAERRPNLVGRLRSNS
jgi:hypothetical protein